MTRADIIKPMMNNDKQHTQRDLEQNTRILLCYTMEPVFRLFLPCCGRVGGSLED